jgi:peroxiredoxin
MFKRTRGAKSTPEAAGILQPGTPAPDFGLQATTDKMVSVKDYRGQPVVLVFYPADWSSVCGDQLTLYNQVLPMFQEHKAQVVAISVDGIWSHKAFAEARNLQFPLLSDFEPKGMVARAYGVYDAKGGASKRALFVLDSQGTIRWSYLSPSGVNPGADGILSALESLGN